MVGVEACYLDELEAEDDDNTSETQQQVTQLCVSNVVYEIRDCLNHRPSYAVQAKDVLQLSYANGNSGSRDEA